MKRMPDLAVARVAAVCALLLFCSCALFAFHPRGAAEAPREISLQTYAVEREESRRRALASLQALAGDENSAGPARERAAEMLLDMLKWIDQEKTIEETLRARGYEGAVCTVTARSVNVLLPKCDADESDVLRIFELAARETGAALGNIAVVPLN